MVKNSDLEKAGVVVSVLLLGGLIFVYGGFTDTQLLSDQNQTEGLSEGDPEEYANPDESTAHEADQTEEADIEIEVGSTGVSPARPQLSVGDTVRFYNDRDQSVSIQSDRFNQEIELEPGESEIYSFSGVTYYQVHEDDELFARGSLSVN